MSNTAPADPSAEASTSNTTSDPASKPEIPWAFIDCPTDTLVVLISHMLNLLIQHNDQVVLTPDALTRFHSRAAPGISVIDYLRRIVKYTNMEKIPLLSLLAYIDLTCAHLPTFTLSTLTVHRFLIAGVCAGSKAQCDVFCTNAHYAKVGGIKVQELNALEREFLRVTQWNLCCNADLLQRYYSSLIRSHGGFAQAAPPEIPPFRAFPRSLSKPRAPASEGTPVASGAPDGPGEAPTPTPQRAGEGEGSEAGEAVHEANGEPDEEGEEGDDGDVTMDSDGGGEGAGSGSRRRRKSVDQVLGVGVEVEGGKIGVRRGRRRKSSEQAVNTSTEMDVDEDGVAERSERTEDPDRYNHPHRGDPAQVSPDANAAAGRVMGIDDTSPDPALRRQASFHSTASSSIPSSSRSSVRGGGGGSIRSARSTPGRHPLSQPASGGGGVGLPAEAVLDRRAASAAGTSERHAEVAGLSTPDVLGGAVRGLRNDGDGGGGGGSGSGSPGRIRTTHGPVNGGTTSEGVVGKGTGDGNGTGTSSLGAEGHYHPEHGLVHMPDPLHNHQNLQQLDQRQYDGHPPAPRSVSGPAHIGINSSSTASNAATGSSSSGSTGHNRLLKNLVGVFRKRPSNAHDPPPGSSSTPSSSSAHHSRDPSPTNTTASHSHETHHSVTTTAGANNAHVPHRPAQITSSRPISHPQPYLSPSLSAAGAGGAGAGGGGGGNITSVTPRIRTRDERSVDSLQHERRGGSPSSTRRVFGAGAGAGPGMGGPGLSSDPGSGSGSGRGAEVGVEGGVGSR